MDTQGKRGAARSGTSFADRHAMPNSLVPVVPAQWQGDQESFVRCLSDFAADVLELASTRCDKVQHFDTQEERELAFNAGVVAATRIVMELASLLKDTQRPSNEWTASQRDDGTG
jgi:hypothetical protein